MADLDVRQDVSNIYSNNDGEVMPLFVRYMSKDRDNQNKNSEVSFDEAVSKLSGVHNCSIIHRCQKNKEDGIDILAIKVDDLPSCLTVRRYRRDEYSVCFPCISDSPLCLPDEQDLVIAQKCDIRFVDFKEGEVSMLKAAGSYWLANCEAIAEFIERCFSLKIPPIEIQIEADKDMWLAYLEGLDAILANKQELIRIKSVTKLKGGFVKLDLDVDSENQNLKDAILEKLESKCVGEPFVSVVGGKCVIQLAGCQVIPKETIDDIESECKIYCYSSDGEPTHSVSGAISIVSDKSKLDEDFSSIQDSLSEFDVCCSISGENEFQFDNDASVAFLKKIVETKFKGIARVEVATKITVPLLPSDESVSEDVIKQILSPDAKINSAQIQGRDYFVISNKRPIGCNLKDFSMLKFCSCKARIIPQHFDPDIKIEGAGIETLGNGKKAYTCVINRENDLDSIGKLFSEVRRRYPNQFVGSTYSYAFSPRVNKSVLPDLKLRFLGDNSIEVDVVRSCVTFKPDNIEEFNAAVSKFDEVLDSSIKMPVPEYKPTARVVFLCEDEMHRRSIYEGLSNALTQSGKRNRFVKFSSSADASQLQFEFRFDDDVERKEIMRALQDSLLTFNGIEITYNDELGVTTWMFSENSSLKNTYEKQLNKEFRNEEVKFIKGKEYDKFCGDAKEKQYTTYLFAKEKGKFLSGSSDRLGVCTERSIDYAIVRVDSDVNEAMKKQVFRINAGDYIQFPAKGEASERKRQSQAMNRILKPHSQKPVNENLPDFIFDPRYAAETTVDVVHFKGEIYSHKISSQINDRQLEAVAKAVLAEDLALIQGPPGTGKTTVIAEIIWQEIRRNPNCRILLTSQTNLAVDNALERLQGAMGIRPVRIGKPDKMEPEGRRFSLPIIDLWASNQDSCTLQNQDQKLLTEENAVNFWIDRIHSRISTDSKYADVVDTWAKELLGKDPTTRGLFYKKYKENVNLLAATCSICGSNEFTNSYSAIYSCEADRANVIFDVVIMDEASKATPLEMAVPLVLGRKIIVIGDHKQLPPMLDGDTIDNAVERIGRKDLAEKLRNVDSQFKRLFIAASSTRKSLVATLDTQYRMHEQIMNTITQFYQEELAETGGLKCGITDTMDIPELSNKGSRWHGITINPIITPDIHAVWIDVSSPEIQLNPGYKNEGELKAIDLVLKALEQSDGYKKFVASQSKSEDKEIGVISFYSAQSSAIKQRYKDKPYRMDVVDRFQGMERNIVIVSTVRSNKRNNLGFAKEIERINVAFSRARRLLIVVGNKQMFMTNGKYKTAIENMKTFPVERLRDAVK